MLLLLADQWLSCKVSLVFPLKKGWLFEVLQDYDNSFTFKKEFDYIWNWISLSTYFCVQLFRMSKHVAILFNPLSDSGALI